MVQQPLLVLLHRLLPVSRIQGRACLLEVGHSFQRLVRDILRQLIQNLLSLLRAAPSFLEVAKPEDPLFVINSFSKPWAMTGWRLGWLTTPNRLGERLEILNEFNVAGASTFVQLAGIVALRDGEKFIAQQVARYQKARDYVYERLVSHTRIRVARPRGAFYAFFAIEGIKDDLAFCQELVKTAKVGLVPGSAFGAPQEGWLRLCFASEIDTLDKALTRLEEVIAP